MPSKLIYGSILQLQVIVLLVSYTNRILYYVCTVGVFFCIEGEDFEDTNAAEYLPARSVTGDQVCAYVPLIDDDYFEKREHFYVHVESEENVEIHGLPYIPVYIYDNDG